MLDKNSFLQLFVDRINRVGMKVLFTVPGAYVDRLLEQFFRYSDMDVILTCHEQGAAYMADGYARMTNATGLVVTTNSPGATNMATAAATAMTENSSVLMITGDISRKYLNLGAFQASDISGGNACSILESATLNAYKPTNPWEAMTVLERYLEQCISSPRPMHLNIPCDFYNMSLETKSVNKEQSNPVVNFGDLLKPESTNIEFEQLKKGNRVCLFIGEEIKSKAQMSIIADFANKYNIPVASNLSSIDVQAFLPDELRMGIFGYAGCERAFDTILGNEIDTIIMLGASLNERNTYMWNLDFFGKQREIIKISQDDLNIPWDNVTNYKVNITEDVIDQLDLVWGEQLEMTLNERKFWVKSFQHLPLKPNMEIQCHDDSPMYMSRVVSMMDEILPDDAVLFLDAGEVRVQAGFFWGPRRKGGLFTAGQTGPMGWGICAAIGAAFTKDDEALIDNPIYALTGDGCMQMNGIEIAIAARYKRKVVFLVSNNNAYGRIASRYKDEPIEVREGLTSLPKISWVDFAMSLGVSGTVVKRYDELEAVLEIAKKHDGPYLIEMFTRAGEESLYKRAVFSASKL